MTDTDRSAETGDRSYGLDKSFHPSTNSNVGKAAGLHAALIDSIEYAHTRRKNGRSAPS